MNWLIDTWKIPSVATFISHKVRVKVNVQAEAEANYTWNRSKTVPCGIKTAALSPKPLDDSISKPRELIL